MYSTPSPSSGGWIALCIKIIENLGITAEKFKKNPGKIYHQFVEAFKYSYAATSYLSDARFNNASEQVSFKRPLKIGKTKSSILNYFKSKQLCSSCYVLHVSIIQNFVFFCFFLHINPLSARVFFGLFFLISKI